MTAEPPTFKEARRDAVVATATTRGLLSGPNRSLRARVPRSLLEMAKTKSGLESTTALIEYALAKVALEDDLGSKLVARKGELTSDLDLEF